jgi:hypothetical protein
MIKPKAGEANSVPKRSTKAKVKSVSKKAVAPAIKQNIKSKFAKKPSTARKNSSKKVTAKKVLVKHLNVRQIEEDTRKIEIIENISRKRPVVAKAQSKPNPALALLGSQLQIALMSPFRMKFDQAQVASNVARYAGTAFVVVGAFLTLYNMNAVASFMDGSSTRSLSAQTTTTTCIPGTYCPPSDGTSGSNGGTSSGTTLTNTIDPTPNVDISIESSSNTIVGTVPVNVTVPYATRIDLMAQNRETNQSQNIGTMFKVSDLVWRTYWQTTGFDDARYRLRAVVTNQFGTYTKENSTDYTVANHPLETIAPTGSTSTPSSPNTSTTTTSVTGTTQTGTPSTTTTETQVSSSTTISLPSVRVEVGMSEPLHDTTNIKTLVVGASGVQHFIRQHGTTNYTTLGYANLYSGATGEWRFAFNTIPLVNGDYDILTRAFFSNNTNNSKLIESLTIQNAGTVATSTSETVSVEPTKEIVSKIYFEFTKQNPMNGVVDVYMQVEGATFVELYTRGEGSLTQKYLGLATKQSENAWKYRFDTALLPNGSYSFLAKVRSQYGDSTSDPVLISIKNTTASALPPPETQTYIDSLKAVGEETKVILATEPIKKTALPPDVNEDGENLKPAVYETSRYDVLADEVGEKYTDEVSKILEEFNDELNQIMHDFGRAMRENDEEKARKLLGELEILRDEVIRSMPYGEDQSEVLGKIRNYMETIIKDIRERTEKSETLIKERVGDAALKDSDSDGVSDYDEINLYDTDPLSADTDKDGYIDGIEILNGYDPKDSAREANVLYESPKDEGVIREDILEVTYVTTLVDSLDGKEQIKAQIGGKALPNSFVTVYIFSTPIVVTLKTDDDGNWSYIFDKELEDGEHEIYIGMTDNAGKIVAKSNPLSFIKTAEAFTPVDVAGAVVSVEPSEPSLLGDRALLVIASIAVVALGLVLILLGLHVRPKEEVPQFA